MAVDSEVVADAMMDMHGVIARWEEAYHASQDRLDQLWNDVTQLRGDMVQYSDDGASIVLLDSLISRLDKILGDDAP